MVLIINFTIIKNIKDEFVLEQLEYSAKAIVNNEKASKEDTKMQTSILVTDFSIDITEDSYQIYIPPFTRSLYLDKIDVIQTIVDIIMENGVSSNIGQLSILNDDFHYYYYVIWDESNNLAKVFLTSTQSKFEFELQGIIVAIFFLILSFFISRIIAKRISHPIQKLEIFAEEVSKRNWNAKVPKTDPDEIGLLAEALDKMRDSLKLYEERDREFLQSTSHDLKTPVMIIKGYSQALLDGIGVDSPQSAAEVILTEAERLEKRITQLLKLNTLSHSLEYTEVRECIRIDRILRSLISKFTILNPELNWQLDLKEIEIKGDSEALLIAFENIIENQLRYAKNSISIVMSTTPKLEIKISNDGPQFEVDDPTILFETYKKDKDGKFGLGLAIVREVIQSHNGTISAYNLEKGVEFKINL
jgi:two-component system sensor histidine kinase CssS